MISIVTPVYNAEEFLRATIETVQKQTYTEWEWFLCDDGSTDASAAIITEAMQTDPRIHLLKTETNGGAAGARNLGIRSATGEYLAFIDADDLWVPEKLERELAFAKEKSADFVFTGYEFADENGVGLGTVVSVPDTLPYRKALHNTTIFTSTVLLHREVIPEELLLMPQIKSEDTATWWKLLRNGYLAHGLNENLVLYRRAKKTLSSNKFVAMKRIWNLYRKAEHLNPFASAVNFVGWAFRAVWRRI